MKDLKTLTKKEKDKLLNLDQALNLLDQLYFSIESRIMRVISGINEIYGDDLGDRFEDLRLRLEIVYQILIEGELAIIESLITYFQVRHGPSKEKESDKIQFIKTYGGKRTLNRVVSFFHTFTTEYSSILDISLQLLLKFEGKTSVFDKKPRSYGQLLKKIRNDPGLKEQLKKHLFLKYWLKYRDLMTSLKNRRDYKTHHRYLYLHPIISGTENEYFNLQYYSSTVKRKNLNDFKITDKSILKYNYFCRAGLYCLFKILDRNFLDLEMMLNKLIHEKNS